MSLDSFNSKRTLTAEGNDYAFFSIDAAAQDGAGEVGTVNPLESGPSLV